MKAAIKNASLEILRRLPVSSEWLGPPKGFHRHTEEWLAAGSKSAARARLHPLVSAASFARKPPITTGGTVPWPFHAYYGGMTASDPAGWVVEMPQGRVVGDGTVITPDDCLLADVSREQITGGDQSKHSVRRRRRLPKVRKVAGTVAVAAVSAASNYWHWHFDVLPRLLLLQELPSCIDSTDTIVVNNATRAFQTETLVQLGIPLDKVLQQPLSRLHLKADRLLVPSLFFEMPSRWACNRLREKLVFPPPHPPTWAAPRLYVSRADAGIRRVLNEEDLMQRLAPLGFQRVTLTGKSSAEQCQLFGAAEIVVAPHGAGLTNILFCRPGTRIIELFSPNYINPCYWLLCNHLDLEHYCSIGSGPATPPPPPGVNVDEWFWSFIDADPVNGRDIRVDVEDVMNLVQRALETGPKISSPT